MKNTIDGTWLAVLALTAVLAHPVNAENSRAGDISRKSETSCFEARTVLTPQSDWLTRLNEGKETLDSLPSTSKLDLGQFATAILAFRCPVREESMATIECDIKITRPDGTVLAQQGGIACFEGEVPESDEAYVPTEIWVDITASEEDGTGTLLLDLGLTDRKAGERLTLELPVELTGKAAE